MNVKPLRVAFTIGLFESGRGSNISTCACWVKRVSIASFSHQFLELYATAPAPTPTNLKNSCLTVRIREKIHKTLPRPR
jgi:hypothetical protein